MALALASCGVIEDVIGDDEAGPREGAVVVLAAEHTASGEGVAAAVERAVDDALDLDGWSIDVVLVDEVGDDEGEDLVSVAEEIASGDVVAVIGGLSTETIRAVQPVFDAESLPFLSPADTVPEHTRGADAGNPMRPYDTYYRVAVSDEDPLYALARHAVGTLDAATVAVIDSGEDGEGDVFVAAVEEAGGSAVRVDLPDEEDDEAAEDDEEDDDEDEELDAASMLARARDEGADAVFVAGRSAAAADVVDEVARQGLDVEILGGSVVTGDDFLAEAGSSADGMWTAVRGELEPTTDLEAAAHDAGTAVALVMNGCLPPASSARSAREGCAGELDELTFTGLTGEVAFDEFGDREGSMPVIMSVRGGSWTPTEP